MTSPEGAKRVAQDFPYHDPQGRLRERVKELRCLYDVLALTADNVTAIETVCAGIVQVLMGSYLHEDRTAVRIVLNDVEVRSPNWTACDPMIEEPIRCDGADVGMLCVGYANADGEALVFLPEEHELTAAIAAHLAKLAEDRLLAARIREAERIRTIGQMTSRLAHDFNNLLTVIVGSAESLRENLSPADANQVHAKLIGEAAERGSTITAQLLAYSRRQPLSPRNLETTRLLHDMAVGLGKSLGDDIAVELDIAGDIWPMHADRAQLETALHHLADNSRDAMPDGGRFRITAANLRILSDDTGPDGMAAGEYVRFDITDTGTGMPDEVAAHAFDPFFTTKEGQGSGLGLSSVIGFVRQSHGRIALTSAVGRGTTISICFPRAEDAPAEPAVRPMPEGTGQRILLVEDEDLVRRLAASALTKLGYTVTAAATAEEARALLAGSTDFELLFTDVMLSGDGDDGIDLAAGACKLHPSLGVLLTSGFSAKATDRADFPFTFISKPYRRADIAEKIVQALRQRAGK